MAFEQAAIKVEKEQEFADLRSIVEHAFRPQKVESFLKRLDRKGVRVRDFEAILESKALDQATGESGMKALHLYKQLSLSDQAQMREFYLSELEAIDVALRHRFKKLYQYY